jgi:hypothetical protein
MVKQTAPTKGKERVITIQPPSGPRPSKIKRYVESTGGPVSITVKPKTITAVKPITVKKRGRPPKKVEASSSPPTDQPKPKPKPKALTGDIKKKWVNFAKKFKKEMKNKGDTDEEITTFAKYYHDLILNSSDQEKTLEEIIQGHTTDDTFIPLYNPQQDQPMEDIVEDKPEQFDVKKYEHENRVNKIIEKEPTLTTEQATHIANVFKIIEKDPTLKADIRRTVTEELAKGNINTDQFKVYDEEIKELIDKNASPEAVRVKKTPKPRAKKSAQADKPIIQGDIEMNSKLPKGKPLKGKEKKKEKVVVL